jgi:hypothetical protein
LTHISEKTTNQVSLQRNAEKFVIMPAKKQMNRKKTGKGEGEEKR